MKKIIAVIAGVVTSVAFISLTACVVEPAPPPHPYYYHPHYRPAPPVVYVAPAPRYYAPPPQSSANYAPPPAGYRGDYVPADSNVTYGGASPGLRTNVPQQGSSANYQ